MQTPDELKKEADRKQRLTMQAAERGDAPHQVPALIMQRYRALCAAIAEKSRPVSVILEEWRRSTPFEKAAVDMWLAERDHIFED